MKMMETLIVIGTIGSPQGLGKGVGRVGNWRTNQDHPNYILVEIGKNIQKNPGDVRRLAVTQTSVKDYQLTL